MLTKQEKIKQVEEISQGFSQGKILVFLDIAGLKVNELNNLRKILKTLGSKLRVVKKRLLKIAFQKTGLEFKNPAGQLGVVFSSEALGEIAGPIYKFSQQNGALKINGGLDIPNKKFLAADLLKQIGQLPSREVLLSRLANVLISPLRALLYVLQERGKKVGQ